MTCWWCGIRCLRNHATVRRVLAETKIRCAGVNVHVQCLESERAFPSLVIYACWCLMTPLPRRDGCRPLLPSKL